MDMPVPNHKLKTEGDNALEHDMQMEQVTDEDQSTRKPWLKRPGAPIQKVAPDVKRRRRNYQAKKLMAPKNPLMILNELKPGLLYKFDEKVSEANQPVFTAIVQVDGCLFSGLGPSKKQAQQEAAEAALRGLFFDKMMEQLAKKEADGDADMKDLNQSIDNQVENVSTMPEDETPWGSLASLAMFKMATQWQTSGTFSAPNTSPAPAPCSPKVSNASSISVNSTVSPGSDLKSKIPNNASEMDPVMLLNQLVPNSKFSELARDVRSGSTLFTLSVDFNGSSYHGSATKKKIAKKLCAKSALKSLGVQYADDEGL
ncbi:hypothetical protein ONE63_007758 [Megalurothrips usitatus]|uniref:DRBM domain-containing protein n=1 Tax=Megalurothrips usitatus TaxID=439358 RepID=A0AAV7XNP0_9NEOP|nr:hypothetical protein ONE63_007758 [Megalurothrips usitatus]